MDESMKYSVIIPVYNAETTIERCLNSLLNQIPDHTELLVINDGSMDRSGEICRKYADLFSNIRYFEKTNGGVSSARNLGLDNAKGEYILFADSDDYVVEEYWATIDSLIDQYHPDMLQYGFRDCGEIIRDRNTGDYAVSGEIPVAKKVDQALRGYLFSSLQVRAFKNDIIQLNTIRFDLSLSIGEDQSFIFSYAMHMNSLVSSSATLYVVILENTESLSRKKRDFLTKQLMSVNQNMLSTLATAKLPVEVKKIYAGSVAWVYYRSAYSSCKELMKYDLAVHERRKKIHEICQIYKEHKIRPRDIKCGVIALPIKFSLDGVIDLLINRR